MKKLNLSGAYSTHKMLSVFIIFTITICSYSQSLVEKKFSIYIDDFPKNPLPSYVKTYKIVIKGKFEKDQLVNNLLKNSINIRGFEKVEGETAADIAIELK